MHILGRKKRKQSPLGKYVVHTHVHTHKPFRPHSLSVHAKNNNMIIIKITLTHTQKMHICTCCTHTQTPHTLIDAKKTPHTLAD
jgi:hypothetical protein